MSLSQYRITLPNVTVAIGQVLCAIINKSNNVLRIYDIALLSSQAIAITGILYGLEVRRYSPTPTLKGPCFDTNLAENWGNVIIHAGWGGVPSGTYAVFRRFMWSGDEVSAGEAINADSRQIVDWFRRVWCPNAQDGKVQPLTIRNDQMFTIHVNASYGGVAEVSCLVDVEILFSLEVGSSNGGVVETIVAKNFPMDYVKATKVKELRSKFA